MTIIPENKVTQEDLSAWFTLQEQLKKLKVSEMLLRQKIFAFYFPEPKEGTNDAPLAEGWVLKGKHVIQRDVDPGAFTAMRELFEKLEIVPDALVQWKPSLKLKEYRELTEKQMHLFDQCLIIKPGSPALEIVQPKKRASGASAAVK